LQFHRPLKYMLSKTGFRAGVALLCLALCAGYLTHRWRSHRSDQDLARRLPAAATKGLLSQPCSATQGQGLRLLVLGQSNAANHGQPSPLGSDLAGAQVFDGQSCFALQDPLPGGTGSGASIWTQLPAALRKHGVTGRLSLSVLAVESTRINDWARASSPLNERLRQQLAALQYAGWRPDLVLWQQGEADAMAGTSAADYQQDFEQLLQTLQAHGVTAPVMTALSTYCSGRTEAGAAAANTIRAALTDLPGRLPQAVLGPDTDGLTHQYRWQRCHFSTTGLSAAAELWAKHIAAVLPAGPRSE
jgi:hypothetical protein